MTAGAAFPGPLGVWGGFVSLALALWPVEAVRSFFSPVGPYADYHLPILVVFVEILLGIILLRLYLRAKRAERARDSIPIAVGGFGTRARAEVEEMKATLFGALGHTVVASSGSTVRYLEPSRLSRSLWIDAEAAGVASEDRQLALACELGAKVFLWENTDLAPERPPLLRHDWFERGISTITGLYADGQTVKGPTAWVLAERAQELVPAGAISIAAEERMLPFIRDAARERGAELVPVSWRDVALLPDDLLQRFPYRVRPESVAIVMKLAERMGLDPWVAAWEIAGSITPGPEAPRLFPEIRYLGRRLRFASAPASDRRGFIEDWRHLGFDRIDPVSDAGTWVVVAAEADDPDRAAFLARLIVRDIRCHRLAVLGKHPDRLLAATRRELARSLEGIALVPSDLASIPRDALVKETLARFDRTLWSLLWEVPTEDAVRSNIRAMLKGIGLPPDLALSYSDDPDLTKLIGRSPAGWPSVEILRAIMDDPALDKLAAGVATSLVEGGIPPRVATRAADEIRRYVRMYRSIHRFESFVKLTLEQGDLAKPSLVDEMNAKYRALIRGIFLEKLWLAPREARGDEVIDALSRLAPPGFQVLVLGTRAPGKQDDLAARFVSLERVAREASRLTDGRSWVRFDALKQLGSYDDYGILDAPLALQAIGDMRRLAENQESHLAQLADAGIVHIKAAAEKAASRLSRAPKEGSAGGLILDGAVVAGSFLVRGVERLIDVFTGWWRVHRIRWVLQELACRRIGYDRAMGLIRRLARGREPLWLARGVRDAVAGLMPSRRRRKGGRAIEPNRKAETGRVETVAEVT